MQKKKKKHLVKREGSTIISKSVIAETGEGEVSIVQRKNVPVLHCAIILGKIVPVLHCAIILGKSVPVLVSSLDCVHPVWIVCLSVLRHRCAWCGQMQGKHDTASALEPEAAKSEDLLHAGIVTLLVTCGVVTISQYCGFSRTVPVHVLAALSTMCSAVSLSDQVHRSEVLLSPVDGPSC